MRFHRPRRWSTLGRVERVDSYTRTSLYLLLWGFCASLLLSADPRDTSRSLIVVVVLGGVVVTALGTLVLAAVIDLYPATRPLPWRSLAPLLAVGVVYVGATEASVDGDLEVAAAIVTIVSLTGSLGGVPDRRLGVLLPVASGVLAWIVGREPLNFVGGVVIGAFVVFTVRASLWMLGIVTELDATRQVQAQLAVAEERLRFSRDVHDVLGRRLSTIAVQAELAATLAERGDDRAAARMLEVRGVAHEALAEARELARGYRPTDLTKEVDGAGSLLRSAGIEVEVAVGVVPRGWHEAAGWVVREGVTNVLRHSAAQQVRIGYDAGELRIENDGLPPSPGRGDGSGLRGLRERLEPLGAALSTETADGRWILVATLPGAGPLSATTGTTTGTTTGPRVTEATT